jgi:hypothetical protein
MIVFDKNTFGSNREIDSNGFLRVDECNISKCQIRPYLGREIPNWREFGLEPDKIYNVYCPKEELEKALPTFNNLPLTREHIEVDVDNVPKEKIVGSLGDHASFEYPYLKNNLIIYDKKDIDLVMSGKKKELSCGYRYTPVRQSGDVDGQHYDFVMTDIIGNHVALVKQGRAGRDVMVADSSKGILETIKEKIMAVFDNDLVGDEFKESEHPRAKNGQFTSAGGSSSSGSIEHNGAKIDIKKDGKYADIKIYAPEGKKFKNGDTFYTTEAEADKAEELAKKIIDNEFGGSENKKDYEEKTQSFSDFYKDFERREDNNDHSGNAVALAKRYGDEKDVKEAEEILKLHDERMELTPDLYKRRRVLEEKFIPMMSKEGDDFEKKAKEHAQKLEERSGSEKKDAGSEKSDKQKEYADWWGGLSDREKKDTILALADKDPKIKELLGEKLYRSIVGDAKLDKAEQEKVGVVMKEFKEGELKSGSGEKVTDPKQAIAIALSEADKIAKDKEIPEKQDEPEKAGDEVALNKGEEEMAEEVKEAPAEEKVEETKEEVVEDACGKAEDKKEVKPACDEKEDKRKLIDEIGGILKDKLSEEDWRTVIKKAEELAYNDSERSADDEKKDDLKGKEKESFAEGVKYGEEKEKAEPKKLDSEHESEGMKKAEEKKEEKKMAKDEAMVMDADAIRAEAKAEVIADFKARETARRAVRKMVGDVDVFAFDSADEIYKFACEKAGMNLNEIVSFKDAFQGLSMVKGGKLAMDASPVSGSNVECFKDIRIA